MIRTSHLLQAKLFRIGDKVQNQLQLQLQLQLQTQTQFQLQTQTQLQLQTQTQTQTQFQLQPQKNVLLLNPLPMKFLVGEAHFYKLANILQ